MRGGHKMLNHRNTHTKLNVGHQKLSIWPTFTANGAKRKPSGTASFKSFRRRDAAAAPVSSACNVRGHQALRAHNLGLVKYMLYYFLVFMTLRNALSSPYRTDLEKRDGLDNKTIRDDGNDNTLFDSNLGSGLEQLWVWGVADAPRTRSTPTKCVCLLPFFMCLPGCGTRSLPCFVHLKKLYDRRVLNQLTNKRVRRAPRFVDTSFATNVLRVLVYLCVCSCVFCVLRSH